MIAKMHDTGRMLVGYDHDSGSIIRRKVYADNEGNEYVRLGRFSSTPDAHVSKQWFCDHIIGDGMVER